MPALKPNPKPYSILPLLSPSLSSTHSIINKHAMAAFAARSALRSATSSARSATAKISAGVKPRAAPSPFRVSSQSPLSARIFRSRRLINFGLSFPFHRFLFQSSFFESMINYLCKFRSPVELSSVSVMSLLPYHTATASAVLTSMLSASPCGRWSIEGQFYS